MPAPQTPLEQLLAALARGPVCLVTVQRVQGSTPREAGAWMAIAQAEPALLIGSIGGGHLEWQAMHQARARLRACAAGQAPDEPLQRQALGPSLGQCCGGVVFLRFECLGPQDLARVRERLAPRLHPLTLFGGGHVGRALVRVLAPLPFAIQWVDSRDEIFPEGLSSKVRCEYSDPVQAAVADIAPGSQVLIMSFSHAEDQDIVAECLKRQRARADLPFIGLIGSKTKWASFRHRLEARGYTEADFAHVTCPIGVPGIVGKDPQVIAVAVAAQLLMRVSPLD
ncbi:xanthine dehydrogenase accessory protein XdhC [Comamonas sp. NLF-1-9]|uniref:xanthine dehydrogenase accessory protein XdhC n=1 Tax=Comamonas sp. NLF-1-9 TaxID=2853163 RepID=UPI001C451483|nr:xanthine dehydrogenase accessory protein XdhC [Comamonas sp. NLF-1-9]QXL85633.1 xanthine dehydrogenase accessory protein XdhC [Comamonas sp. NLF-1-9]